MKNIHLTITKENIQEYMKKNVSLVRHKEPLFVDYMKRSKGMTLEGLEILFKKYYEEIPLTKIDYQKNEVMMHLLTFEDYLKNSTFDMNAIFHILIPALRLDGGKHINHCEIFHGAYEIAEELLNETPRVGEKTTLLYEVIDNYVVARQIDENQGYNGGYSTVLMRKEKCEKELLAYEHIYGQENIQKIKELVKEREW